MTFVGVNTVTMSDMEKQGLVAFGWQGSFQGILPGISTSREWLMMNKV